MKPRRGEVWLFDLGMAEKVRPAFVVSVDYGDSDRALITILPHTTSLRGSRYEIPVNVPFLKPGAFLVQNVSTYPSKNGEWSSILSRLVPALPRRWHFHIQAVKRTGSPLAAEPIPPSIGQ